VVIPSIGCSDKLTEKYEYQNTVVHVSDMKMVFRLIGEYRHRQEAEKKVFVRGTPYRLVVGIEPLLEECPRRITLKRLRIVSYKSGEVVWEGGKKVEVVAQYDKKTEECLGVHVVNGLDLPYSDHRVMGDVLWQDNGERRDTFFVEMRTDYSEEWSNQVLDRLMGI